MNNGNKLYLPVDSEADISLLKAQKLSGTAEFEPTEKIRIKSVEGSVIETHGSIEAKIQEGDVEIPFQFQLVNQQVDLKGDGILGRDFLTQVQAQICYKTRSLTFTYEGTRIRKELSYTEAGTDQRGVGAMTGKIRLPPRAETVVSLRVGAGSVTTEGLVEKKEIISGVYLAECLVRVANERVITSIMNTREEELEIEEPMVKVTELGSGDDAVICTLNSTSSSKPRGERVMEALRTEHLNPEEQRSLREICFEYQDVFYLPGDQLSSTNAVKHSINVEPGTAPINTRQYRLPESQKQEVDTQVTKLLREGIIQESASPWNSPLLIVPKKIGEDGKQKWRLVVDFRRLNEKTIGNAHPLPDITEILDQLGQS